TMAGAVAKFTMPSGYSEPLSCTSGPDGNLWFTESGVGKIGRITPGGVLTEFSLPTTGGQTNTLLGGIARGPDGNLWFTWSRMGATVDERRIGRITPSGAVSAFPLSLPYNDAEGIIAGPDGNLWFAIGAACTEPCHQPAIGRITPSGTITTFPFPAAAYASPYTITKGADGNL